MSRTAITLKFKMCPLLDEACSCAEKLLTDINLPSLMPNEDNNFSGSLVSDFRKWWRHVQPKNRIEGVQVEHAIIVLLPGAIESGYNNYNHLFLFESSSVCPNGITNTTGNTGYITYPSSGEYGVNETRCWMFKVPEPYVKVAFVFHRYTQS